MDSNGQERIIEPWDWKSVRDIEGWNEPSEEGHYYANVWNRNGGVLDLGCGLGRHSILFASHGLKVTAFDSSEYAVDELRKRASDLILTSGAMSVTCIPYRTMTDRSTTITSQPEHSSILSLINEDDTRVSLPQHQIL